MGELTINADDLNAIRDAFNSCKYSKCKKLIKSTRAKLLKGATCPTNWMTGGINEFLNYFEGRLKVK
jgi:hypothetical protein